MRFLDARAPIAFAHRGFAPDGSENTMAAFERAVQLGYRYLETDVRVTSDGVAVAFHDATLDRVTDQRGCVSDLPWGRVRQARIGGTEAIPLLADVLAAWPRVCVNIDVKVGGAIGPTVDAIRRTAAADRVCVGAFSGARIAAIRRALGESVCMPLAPRDVISLRLAATCGRLPRRALGNCVQVPARIGRARFVDDALVRAAHALGLPIHVWTVNSREEMQHLLELGVDGLMTDAADVLRAVLVGRGQWPAAVSDA